MKKHCETILALFIGALILGAFVSSAAGATGSLLWAKNYMPSTKGDRALGTAVDSTGVYIVGYDHTLGTANGQWRIQKRNLSTGSLIWSKTTNPSNAEDEATDVAVYGGNIYVVGYMLPGGAAYARIEKRNSTTGNLIWSKTSTATDFIAHGVAVDSTGVYIVGSDSALGWPNTEWRIEKRSLSTGNLIWSATSNLSSSNDEAYRVAVGSTGVYIVGYSGYVNSKWRIEKRNSATGKLIWSVTASPGFYNELTDVAVDSTGLYVVGYEAHVGRYGQTDFEWAIQKRNLSTGAVIWSTHSNPSDGTDMAYGVAVSSAGVYIVGIDAQLVGYTADTEWRIEKRSLSTGNLIWAKTSNPSSTMDYARDVAVSSSGVYIVGSYHDAPTVWLQFYPGWRIEKRQP